MMDEGWMEHEMKERTSKYNIHIFNLCRAAAV